MLVALGLKLNYGLAVLTAAIEFQAQHEWPRVRAECHELARLARESITELTELPPLVPDPPAWFAQMAAIPLPPGDEKSLKARLYDEYRVEAPIIAWEGQRFVRVSAQGYTTREDIERLTDALAAILAGGG